MSSYEDIKKRLEKYWIDYLNKNIKNFSSSISGASPPSVFVGQYGYPRVSLGPMVPPLHGDTKVLDSPEMWIGKNLQEILDYRLSLVRGVNSFKVTDVNQRFITSLQELIMSSKSAESEMNFHSTPQLYSNIFSQNSSFNFESPPFGPKVDLKSFKVSSITTNKKIEYYFSDGDIKAASAVVELYKNGIEISQINKILSLGMLGKKKNRKLVPTRWSISATDDIISTYLIKELEHNPPIDSFAVLKYNHFSNYYSVILLPSEVWSFEMVEAWYDGKDKKFVLESDFEDANGLDHYPKIAGAYFAARLAVAEYLSRMKRKSAVLIFREIHPDYIIPLGVWQIREGIREVLRSGSSEIFDDFQSALMYSCKDFKVSISDWIHKSKLYKNYGQQLRISQFFK